MRGNLNPCICALTVLGCTTSIRHKVHLSRNVRKHTFAHERPAKTQISLRIRTVWSEYANIDNQGCIFFDNNEDPNHSARMHMLIWVYVGRTFRTLRLILFCVAQANDTILVFGFSIPLAAPHANSHSMYRIYPKYSDIQAWANSEDSDQTPRSAASDQGLHCLPHI